MAAEIFKASQKSNRMCLILLSWQESAQRPLVVAANRDEFFQRPTEAAHFWPDQPDVLAGRDGEYGGSWLGLSRSGRFAAITNLREASGGECSRGELVRDFLSSSTSCDYFFESVEANKAAYRPFNMIAFDGQQLAISHSLQSGWQALPPGLHCVGNIPFGEHNAKINKALSDFEGRMSKDSAATLLALMQDDTESESSPEPLQRALSCRFVRSDVYGTRSSSALMLDDKHRWDFWEQNFDDKQRASALQYFQLQGSVKR